MHAGHSAFVIESGGFRLLCDFGENRKGMLSKIRPDAVFVSHAHPDHGWGLWEGTDLPVYASAATHELLRELPLLNRIVLEPRASVTVGPFGAGRASGDPLGPLPERRRPDRSRELHARLFGRHRRVRRSGGGALRRRFLRGRRLDADGLARAPPRERRPARSHDRSRSARLARAARHREGGVLPLREGPDRDGGGGARGGARKARGRQPSGLRRHGRVRRARARGRVTDSGGTAAQPSGERVCAGSAGPVGATGGSAGITCVEASRTARRASPERLTNASRPPAIIT